MNAHTDKIHQHIIALAKLKEDRAITAAEVTMAAIKHWRIKYYWYPTGIWGTPKGRKARGKV
jgi:hypothetical protein